MIKCKPERNPKQAILMIAVCAAVFLGAGYMASTLASYKWASQAAALVAVTIGIFIIYRYTMTEMIYSVGDGSFTVVKKVGNQETTVCSLDVSTAKALIPKKQFTPAKKASAVKILNHNQNLRPSGSYVYISDFNGKEYAIEFEPNAPFVEAFLAEIEKSKPDDKQGAQ